MYSHETIRELNLLSKEVFGSTSKWRKMIEKGVAELVTEDTTRLNHDGTTQTVNTPKMHAGKNEGEMLHYTIKHYTAESIKEYMLNVLVQRQKIAEARKKEEQDRVQQATGTSV